MKNILVASDLSARSDRAVARAVELARSHGCSLTLLHVIDNETPKRVAESLKSAAVEQLSSILDDIDSSARSLVSINVISGQVHRSIVREAQSVGANLIVLGIHRNQNTSLPVIGSTMERVVRESPVPVLVAMRPVGEQYRRAVVGVDFSVHTEPAVAAAKLLVPEGEIHLIHAYHVPFGGFLSNPASRDELEAAYQRDLLRLIDGRAGMRSGGSEAETSGDCRIRTHSIEGEVRAVLRGQVSAIDAELLVLGSGGRGGLARMWLGSVAEDFLVHPPCDVLVVKE